MKSENGLPPNTGSHISIQISRNGAATSVPSNFPMNTASTARTTAAASFPAGNATHGWQHRKMATADVLFEVSGQKLRQDMLYELIFLKLVTANALCSRSFSCKGVRIYVIFLMIPENPQNLTSCGFLKNKPKIRFELTTPSLRVKCSTG